MHRYGLEVLCCEAGHTCFTFLLGKGALKRPDPPSREPMLIAMSSWTLGLTGSQVMWTFCWPRDPCWLLGSR